MTPIQACIRWGCWLGACLALVLLLVGARAWWAAGEIAYATAPSGGVEIWDEPYVESTLQSADGVKLYARFATRPGSASTALLLIGDDPTRARMQQIASELLARNISVMLLDLRGYGRSSGVVSSMGDGERLDVAAALEAIERAQGSAVYISVVGTGWGATAALCVSGMPRIRCVAAIMPFLSTDAFVREALQSMPIAPPVFLTRWMLEMRMGWRLDAVQPIAALSQSNCDTLFLLDKAPRSLALLAQAYPKRIFMVKNEGDDANVILPFILERSLLE